MIVDSLLILVGLAVLLVGGDLLVRGAVGIATALPAVLAYNYFLRHLRLRVTELENFALDFMRLALKHNFKG